MTSRCLLDRYKIGFGKAGFPHAAGFNVVEVLKVVNSESEKRNPNPPKRGDSGRHSHERTGCKARRWSGKAGLIAKLRRNSAPPTFNLPPARAGPPVRQNTTMRENRGIARNAACARGAELLGWACRRRGRGISDPGEVGAARREDGRHIPGNELWDGHRHRACVRGGGGDGGVRFAPVTAQREVPATEPGAHDSSLGTVWPETSNARCEIQGCNGRPTSNGEHRARVGSALGGNSRSDLGGFVHTGGG